LTVHFGHLTVLLIKPYLNNRHIQVLIAFAQLFLALEIWQYFKYVGSGCTEIEFRFTGALPVRQQLGCDGCRSAWWYPAFQFHTTVTWY